MRAYHRVARAKHDELGRVDDADAFSLHSVQTTSCAVQNHVYQAIIQQIHLIHIQDASVGFCLQSRDKFILISPQSGAKYHRWMQSSKRDETSRPLLAFACIPELNSSLFQKQSGAIYHDQVQSSMRDES